MVFVYLTIPILYSGYKRNQYFEITLIPSSKVIWVMKANAQDHEPLRFKHKNENTQN